MEITVSGVKAWHLLNIRAGECDDAQTLEETREIAKDRQGGSLLHDICYEPFDYLFSSFAHRPITSNVAVVNASAGPMP